jgi:hypothetical protein
LRQFRRAFFKDIQSRFAEMLPIPVPVGSWRFPTDNLLEFNSPFFDNEGVTWGPSILATGIQSKAHQSSLDIYNEWYSHAYDWNAIFEFLQEVDFRQAAIWGFEYRGPLEVLLTESSQDSQSTDSAPDSDPIESPLQASREEEDDISDFADSSAGSTEDQDLQDRD